MASLGHIAVGAAAARWRGRHSAAPLWPSALALSALSLLPDLDVIGFRLHVPYGATFGHRGASHSLVAALAVGVVAAALSRPLRLAPASTFLWVTAVVATHGLLDTLTDGGLGVALLWPFSLHRFFAPWRPIPVAPIGAGMLSVRGLRVASIELLQFLPLVAYACWPRRLRPPDAPPTGRSR